MPINLPSDDSSANTGKSEPINDPFYFEKVTPYSWQAQIKEKVEKVHDELLNNKFNEDTQHIYWLNVGHESGRTSFVRHLANLYHCIWLNETVSFETGIDLITSTSYDKSISEELQLNSMFIETDDYFNTFGASNSFNNKLCLKDLIKLARDGMASTSGETIVFNPPTIYVLASYDYDPAIHNLKNVVQVPV